MVLIALMCAAWATFAANEHSMRKDQREKIGKLEADLAALFSFSYNAPFRHIGPDIPDQPFRFCIGS